MLRLWTIFAVFAVGVTFAGLIPLQNVMVAMGSAITALSIMTAAVFVRLNRGMPTLDWKPLTVAERKKLSGAVLDLTAEYAFIVCLNATALIVMVIGSVYDTDYWIAFPDWMGRALSGAIGALLALVGARMGYVVWRDFDVVRLQKTLIDQAGEREEQERQAKVATQAIETMRTANLRPAPTPPPSAWPNE